MLMSICSTEQHSLEKLRAESVSVMGHELTMGVSSTGSRCSGAWHYKVTTRSGTEVTTTG